MIKNNIFVIAEAGNNHEGNINIAYDLIGQARACGCDAVKFQAGTAEGFARSPDKVKAYEKYVLTLEDFTDLIKYGEEIGIPVFFSIWSAEYEPLRTLEKFHKIPVRQCTKEIIKKYDGPNTFVSIPNFQDTRYLGLGIRLSTPLHCVPEYPTVRPALGIIIMLADIYGKAGYSDHTIGIETCIEAAEDFGACVIEKHFTLDKNTQGLRDHVLSANPVEMKRLVEAVKSL